MEKDRLAEAGIYAALNNYYAAKPKVEPEQAKEDMLRLRQHIDIMLEKIDAMQFVIAELKDRQ
jgi:hypothetical protein